MNYIAIIPARGGSKGVKNKNLQLVDDVSLVARAIIAAKKVKQISRIIVSTDSELIESEALKHGGEVHQRRKITSTDDAKTIDVLREVCQDKKLQNDICILLQPTSPLRQSLHIQNCIDKYESLELKGSVITGTTCEHHPFKSVICNADGSYQPIRHLNDLESPRQRLPKALRVNGAVYIAAFEQLVAAGSFFVEPINFVEMDEIDSIDIDTYEDLTKANLIAKGIDL